MNGKIRIGTELDTKSFDAQIEKLEGDLQRKQKELEELLNIRSKLRFGDDIKGIDKDIEKLQSDIERTNNSLIDLKNKGENAGKITSKSFEKGISTLKRYALAIFSIRGAYELVSRASRTYLNQNEAMGNKIQSVWNTLAEIVGPVIETIVNWLVKAIAYFNVFLKALTGIDFIARANARAIDKQTKSQNKLNKSMASFDEMNTVSSSSNGKNGSNIGGLFEMPELDEGIVKRLQDMATWLKENWDWIWKVGAALLAVFTGAKLAKILGGIGSLLGGGAAGLLGLKVALAGIAAVMLIETIRQVGDLVEGLKQVQKERKNLQEGANKLGKQTDKLIEKIDNESETWDKNSRKVRDNVQALEGSIKSESNLRNSTEATIGAKIEYTETIFKEIKAMGDLYNQGLLNERETAVYKSLIEATAKGETDLAKVIDETNKKYQEQELRTQYLNGQISQEEYLQRVLGNSMYNTMQKAKESDDWFGTFSRTIERLTNNQHIVSVTSKMSVDDSEIQKYIKILKGSKITASLGDKLASVFNIKLATGGIINNPGRGVALGGAIGGEAGAEGVIPLTDSQAMETIGEAIGKYININLTNVTSLDGRIIARQINQVQSNKNFAMNR